VTIFIYIAASLDNYIAGPGGALDWLKEIPNPTQSDYGFAEFLRGIDAVVMGRNTFETVLGFDAWPYSIPVFVLSRSLNALPENTSGKAELIRGEPVEVVRVLGARGFHNLYVDGGRTIQGFLEADQIDEMIITHVPILLGDGVPLFGKLPKEMKFRLVSTERLNETLVKCRYLRDQN
jgi:dihydrofolate reductase